MKTPKPQEPSGTASGRATGSARPASKQETAEIPASYTEAPKWALRLISMSSSRDFRDDQEWGKWCRSVAGAGLSVDEQKLEWLEKELGYDKRPNAPGERPGQEARELKP